MPVDPLSMTSLGITICRGLVYACRAWKDFSSDIPNICSAVEDLLRILEELQTHLNSSSSMDADVNSVQRCIEGCKDGLKSLEEALNAIKSVPVPVGAKAKARLKLQRVLYPFNKETLTNLQATVVDLRNRLSFALQVFNTKAIDSLKLEMREISKTFLESVAVASEARVAVQELSDNRLSVVQYENNNNVKLMHQPIEEIVEHLGRISQSSNPALVLIGQFLGSREDQDVGQAVWKLMSKPALHRGMLQAMRSIRGNGSNHNSIPKGRNSMSFDYIRPGQQAAWQLRSLRTVMSRIRLLGACLAKSVEAISQTTRGAGGSAIAMSMKLRGVTFDESPAFALLPLFQTRLGLSTVEASLLLMRGTVSKLETLFREGRASPTDVDSCGNTLFHVAVCAASRIVENARGEMQQKYEDVFFEFYSNLKRLGVPVNDVNQDGRTAIDSVTWDLFHTRRDISKHIKYYSRLLLLGAEPSGKAISDTGVDNARLVLRPWRFPSFTYVLAVPSFSIVSALARDEDTAEATSCGRLSQAVLSQSLSAVEIALLKCPESVSERNALGQTPLHLAVGWPPGVNQLLEAGADIDAMDKFSQTPLLYACNTGCLETVSRLLVGGSALRSHLDQGHSEHVRSALEVALEERPYSIEMVKLLIEALSNRRKQLLDLANGMLSADRLVELQVVKGRTLDERASDVYDALIGLSSAIPVALYSHSRELGTVFHMYQHDPKIADQLYDAGFRDIEGYNARCLTPLMFLDLHSLFAGLCLSRAKGRCLFSWLLSKGASLLTVQRGSRWRALHYIAARMGIGFLSSWANEHKYVTFTFGGFESRCIDEISDAMDHYGTLTLVTQTSDGCLCACSSTGCTMTISMLKVFSSYSERPALEKAVGCAIPRSYHVDLWLSLVENDSTIKADTSVEILRFMLFEELGLTHTCCRFHFDSGSLARSSEFMGGTNPEYARMIQEEEADIIRDLEGLLDLAIDQWVDFGGSLSEFIDVFIADKLKPDPQHWDDAYIRDVEDLGVKIDRAPVDQAGSLRGELCKRCRRMIDDEISRKQ